MGWGLVQNRLVADWLVLLQHCRPQVCVRVSEWGEGVPGSRISGAKRTTAQTNSAFGMNLSFLLLSEALHCVWFLSSGKAKNSCQWPGNAAIHICEETEQKTCCSCYSNSFLSFWPLWSYSAIPGEIKEIYTERERKWKINTEKENCFNKALVLKRHLPLCV